MKKFPRILVRVFLILAVVCMLTFTVSGILAGHEVARAEKDKAKGITAGLTETAKKDEPAAPTPEPTPAPTPEPATAPAFVKAESIRAVGGTLSRGDIINIVDNYDENYYVLQDAKGDRYFVARKYIRTTEPAYGAEKSFFTVEDTPVYSTAYLEGTPDAKLAINSMFVVSDELNGAAFGKYQDSAGNMKTGYVDTANLSAEELSTWTECDGYIAVDKTGIYANPDLKGTPTKEVVKRAQVHAYEKVGDALRIKVIDSSVPVYGEEGYISANAFSNEIPGYGGTAYNGYTGGGDNSWSFDSGYSDYTGGTDYSGGSSTGGSTGGGGNVEPSGPLYGEDIHLAHADKIVIVADFISISTEQTPELKITGTKGTVFSNGVELISAFYNKGETVSLIAKDNDLFWTVLADHKVCTIPAYSVRLEGEPEEEEEPEFKETVGYIAQDKVSIYTNPEMSGTPIAEVAIRVSVRAYEKVGNALLIEVIDPSVPVNGVKGYISANAFSEEMPGYTWQTYTPETGGEYGWGYTGGFDYGGIPDYSGWSSGGSSGGSSTVDSGAEWSVPVL